MSRLTDRRARLMLKRISIAMEPLPEIQAEKIRDVLAAEAARPMRGGQMDLQHCGLFGDGHWQKDLF